MSPASARALLSLCGSSSWTQHGQPCSQHAGMHSALPTPVARKVCLQLEETGSLSYISVSCGKELPLGVCVHVYDTVCVCLYVCV